MIHALREKVRIKPGGVIELSSPELPVGEEAEVIVMLDSPPKDDLSEAPIPESRRPIWEVLIELGATVPDSEWAKVPTDLAKNLDHYLYGAPKQEE